MDTFEHTELGNAITFRYLNQNPYLRLDESGALCLKLQRFGEHHLPVAMDLELTAGEIIAMAGDYFTEANWTMTLDLPHYEDFETMEELGAYLIASEIKSKETDALIKAYNNLAAPDVTRKKIDTIYQINKTTYIPFFSTLNTYFQELMLSLWVKDYGEMLVRNHTHFTPWSVRVYILGHAIALAYAKLSHDLMSLARDPNHKTDNGSVSAIKAHYEQSGKVLDQAACETLAHQYHAQAYCMELFSFHYYSDHFAAGHMAMVGDLRVVLPEKFGILGSILANNLHDELNRVGVYTYRPYDPTPNPKEPPTRAKGDGTFGTCINEENKTRCVKGMTMSIQDIDNVLQGKQPPHQKSYGGLEHLPDIDDDIRQPEPLLMYAQGKVFYRSTLSKINILAPSEYAALRKDPASHGYTELTNKWYAFWLVFKLRVLSYFYTGVVQPLSDEKLATIVREEQERNPGRDATPSLPVKPQHEPVEIPDWSSNTPTEVPRVSSHSIFRVRSSNENEAPEIAPTLVV